MFPAFIVPFLCVLLYQDVKHKLISSWLFILLFGYFVWNSLTDTVLEEYTLNTSINLCFYLLLNFSLRLLLKAQYAVWHQIAVSFLRLWHVNFYFILCFAFPPLTFLLYFCVNMLLVYAIQVIYPPRGATKPVLGIHVAILLLWSSIVVFGAEQALYDDAWVADLLRYT